MYVETIEEIGFHALNSTYTSTICDISSARYACAIAEKSMSDGHFAAFSILLCLNIIIHQFWSERVACASGAN